MTEQRKTSAFRTVLLGKRYYELRDTDDQIRYLTVNYIFMVAVFPLVVFGFMNAIDNQARAIVDFAIALVCILSIFLMRSTHVPLKKIPVIPATAFGAYCIFLLLTGEENLWISVWIFAFPLIVIYLCRLVLGVIESLVIFAAMVLILCTPLGPYPQNTNISLPFISAYILITCLAIIYELISIKKEKKEKSLTAKLSYEMNRLKTMQNNIPQGIFLMDKELKILPQYSKSLVTILAYYDSELAGKNFLDILSSSLDARQLQIMKIYFEMIFKKTKSENVLESANPISEFVYKVDDRKKVLATTFHLLEEEGFEHVIIGILQDITREKGFENELNNQRKFKEQEMKDMIDIIRIDPLVFQDFIEDAESSFNYINSILKDRTMSEKQVVQKFYHSVKTIKLNASILGMNSLTRKLHAFELYIKELMIGEVRENNILSLAIKMEELMVERDKYISIVKKIEAFKNSNQVDTIIVHTMNKAVETAAAETQKKVELKAGYLDMGILKSKLRRPIKDIFFRCIHNSIHNSIESVDERINSKKRPQGLLEFKIKNVEGKAEITFSDDGRGLDLSKIKKKYFAQYPQKKNPCKKNLLSFVLKNDCAAKDEAPSGLEAELCNIRDLAKQNSGSLSLDTGETGLSIKITLPMPK